MEQNVKPKILVVEDDRNIRKVVTRTLSKKYDIQEAGDGWEAIQKSENSFDLVILDIMMPGIAGDSAFTAMDSDLNNENLETAQAPPTLLLTALPETDERVKRLIKKENIVGYIQKPFHAAALLEKIDALLDPSSDQDALDK